MSDLSSSTEHAGVTDEDLEAFLSGNPNIPGFALSDADPDPVHPETTPPEDTPPADAPAEDAPAPGEGTEGEGEGVEEATPTDDPQPEEGGDGGGDTPPSPSPEPEPALSPEELAQVIAIRDAVANDPGLRDRIAEYYRGGGTPSTPTAPTPAAVTPPEFTPFDPTHLDLNDPSVAALYTYMVEQQQAIELLRQHQTQIANQSYEAMRVQSDALYTRAAESFKKDRDLSDDDLNRIASIATRLNVLPSLMSGTDPMTGLPVRPDPISAMTRALDIAYNSIPEFASKNLARAEATTRRHNTRKQKLAAVAGSSGSVPRTPAPPRDPRQAMIQEVAEMMTGDWSAPSN